jgi:hypothetical protein
LLGIILEYFPVFNSEIYFYVLFAYQFDSYFKQQAFKKRMSYYAGLYQLNEEKIVPEQFLMTLDEFWTLT